MFAVVCRAQRVSKGTAAWASNPASAPYEDTKKLTERNTFIVTNKEKWEETPGEAIQKENPSTDGQMCPVSYGWEKAVDCVGRIGNSCVTSTVATTGFPWGEKPKASL